MNNIAVMGDKMSVFGYAATGAYPAVCENEKEANEVFDNLIKEEYKIIFITENVAEWVREKTEKYRFLPSPSIILIPGASGNTGKGIREVDISVEKAIGSKII